MNGNSMLDREHLRIFDFDHVIQKYATVFHVTPTVLLFEDLREDSKDFWSRLGSALTIDCTLLEDLAEEKHRRKSETSGDGVEVSVMEPTFFGRIVRILAGNNRFTRWSTGIHYLRN
jgi:hypothetical protein